MSTAGLTVPIALVVHSSVPAVPTALAVHFSVPAVPTVLAVRSSVPAVPTALAVRHSVQAVQTLRITDRTYSHLLFLFHNFHKTFFYILYLILPLI